MFQPWLFIYNKNIELELQYSKNWDVMNLLSFLKYKCLTINH